MIKKMRAAISQAKDTIGICIFSIKMSVEGSARYFFVSIGCSVFLIALPFIEVYILSTMLELLTNAIVAGPSTDRSYDFLVCVVLLLISQVFSKGIMSVKSYADGMHREIMHQHIKYKIMEKTASLDLEYFDSSHFYDEMSDASNNSPLIIDTAFKAMDFIRYFVQLIIALFYMCTFSPVFAFVLLVSTVPEVVFQQRQLNAMYNLQRKNLQEERKMYYTAGLATSRACYKDIQLYNLFPLIGGKYKEAFKALFSQRRELSSKYTKILLICTLLPQVLTIAIIFQLGLGVLNGHTSIGDFSYYQGIIGQLLGAAYSVIFNYEQLMNGKIRIENYLKFMTWENKVLDTGTEILSTDDIDIEFRNVSFRYAEDLPFILKNISFVIPQRTITALVGINGSGKTTIVKLLMRFYDPTSGDIYISGKNIKQYTIESLRNKFSVLFQDYFNYAFSVRESVSLSDYHRCENTAEVKEALRQGGALDFVSKFPLGVETYMTRQYDEKGEELSGGQWQKIAVARTFFRKANFYILDEPSAALDAEAEDELFRQFQHLYKGKTAIIISHRLSNIALADQILMIENGTILERGTHHDLIQANGRYSYLYKLQADKYSAI